MYKKLEQDLPFLLEYIMFPVKYKILISGRGDGLVLYLHIPELL